MHNDQRSRDAGPDASDVRTAQQYANQAIGRAELTRAAAQVAMEKATRPDVRELAGYELMEAKAVVALLRDLGAQVPAMGQDARSALEMITNASKGPAFDRAYITAQCQNHAYLRDLTAAYLECSDPHAADEHERQGRQLATMALCSATEHAAVCNRIAREIRS